MGLGDLGQVLCGIGVCYCLSWLMVRPRVGDIVSTCSVVLGFRIMFFFSSSLFSFFEKERRNTTYWLLVFSPSSSLWFLVPRSTIDIRVYAFSLHFPPSSFFFFTFPTYICLPRHCCHGFVLAYRQSGFLVDMIFFFLHFFLKRSYFCIAFESPRHPLQGWFLLHIMHISPDIDVRTSTLTDRTGPLFWRVLVMLALPWSCSSSSCWYTTIVWEGVWSYAVVAWSERIE